MSRLALYSGARSTMNSTAALHSIAPSAIGDARVPLCLLQWYRKCSRCHSKAGSGNSTHAQPTPATRSGVTRVHTVLCHAKWYGRSRYSTARQRVWRHGGACALVAAEWHSLYSAAGSTLRLLAIDRFPAMAFLNVWHWQELQLRTCAREVLTAAHVDISAYLSKQRYPVSSLSIKYDCHGLQCQL